MVLAGSLGICESSELLDRKGIWSRLSERNIQNLSREIGSFVFGRACARGYGHSIEKWNSYFCRCYKVLGILEVGTQHGYCHSVGLVKNVGFAPLTNGKVYALSVNWGILTKLILNLKFYRLCVENHIQYLQLGYAWEDWERTVTDCEERFGWKWDRTRRR